MRLVVNLEQALAIDLGIGLGGREAGVAQQLLDLPQVGAGRQQVRSERMAQGVRGGRIGLAEGQAQAFHEQLHDAWA